MLCRIPRFILHSILNQKFVNLRFQHESNVYQVFTELVKEACGAFSLECSELVEIGPQLLRIRDSSATMLAHLVPGSVDVSDFILKKELVTQPQHDLLNLRVRGCHKDATSFFDLVFSFIEVVVELVNELVTFIDGCDMALSSAISLSFNHDAPLL